MRAISLHQPWASLIAHRIKTIETRDWSTTWRGPLAIHASKRWTQDQHDRWNMFAEDFAPRFPPLGPWLPKADRRLPPLGVVVAMATITACRTFTERADGSVLWGVDTDVSDEDVACGDTTPGRWGWLLERVLTLDVPMPMKGQQGLWTPEHDERATLSVAPGWWANEAAP